MSKPKPLVLVILDGFGVSLETAGNPVAEAKKPVLEMLEKNFPFTTLQASGTAVGLPWGEAGNSEVGHLTIGAGRIIYHSLPRIINAIADGSFFKNEVFLKIATHVASNKSRLHVMGLVSSGSVHSYVDHLYAFLDFTKQQQIDPVYIHVFSDGKDAPLKEGVEFLSAFEEKIKKEWPHAKIVSVIGRIYALDRGGKWDRTQKTYSHLIGGEGEKITSLKEYLQASYAKNITDECIEPAYLAEFPDSFIKENDALVITDFREDSVRQITHAITDETFEHFPRGEIVPNLLTATMTEYEKGMRALAAFPPLDIRWPLAEVLSDAQLRHLHIAETQKYAHVTYFLNGGIEKPFIGEERILITSRDIHFDEAPEMRADDIAQAILDNYDKYDCIIANFANADMVGHTGNFNASIKAVEAIDAALKKIVERVSESEGAMIITGDHGNIERKINLLSGEKLTEHSTNPVYLVLVGRDYKLSRARTDEEVTLAKQQVAGILTDVTPTVLEILGLRPAREMTGQSLLELLLKQKIIN